MEYYADEKKILMLRFHIFSIHMDVFNKSGNAQHIVYVGRESFFI